MKLSMSFHFITTGSHTYVRVFAGPDPDHRAACGSITFRNEEWDLFRDHLRVPGTVGIEFVSVELIDETPSTI